MNAIKAVKKYLANHVQVASAIRHFVTAAGSSFAVAVLPVVQDLGAGKYDISTGKAIVISAAVGAISAGARAVWQQFSGEVAVEGNAPTEG